MLTVPWLFLVWFVAQGFAGNIDGFLVFFLLFILVPLAVIFNFATIVFFRGKDVFQTIKRAQQGAAKKQEPLQSTNYADLPWWNPRRWFK